MAITFLLRLYRIRFSLLVARKCHKIAPFIRDPLKIFSCPSLRLGVSVLSGVLSLLPLSAFSQNAEVGPTLSATESPSAISGESDRPSRDVPVETNPNPVNENFRRFRYSFGVTVRDVYDDNINLSSTNRVGDWFFVVEPEIHLGFGDSQGGFNYLAFDYILSAYFFADQTERNGVEHIIHLGAQHDFGHLVLGLNQDVQILDGTSLNSLSSRTGAQANTDVNGPSRSNTYTTSVNASYDLTGKLFLSGQAGYARTDYETFVSSQIISGNIYLNYVYSPKLVIGLGTTGGVTLNDGPTGDEIFEQINARANYIVSGKISLSISAGIEFRQFDGGESVSPVYDIAGSYRPFENTTITIAGSRNTRTSASLAGQDFSETSISLTFSQRLLSRFTLSLGIGYTNSEYLSASTGNATVRSDDYFYIEPAIDLNVTRYWSIGFYYLYREDSSTLALFSFYDNQFGFRSSLTF
jgi:hypothetical protein